MTDSDLPVPAAHVALTDKEVEAFTKKAFALERRIKGSYTRVHEAWWALGKDLYEFHEGGYWSGLGYDTLGEFLGQPDLGISRSEFFRMTKLWRDLVVVRKIAPSELEQIEPSKVKEEAPAIERGEIKIEDALDDAKSLSFSDIKTKYRPAKRRSQKPDDSEPLAAEDEPVLVRCEKCGSWVEDDDDKETE